MTGDRKHNLKNTRLIIFFVSITVMLIFFIDTAQAQLDCKKCHKYMTTKKFVHSAMQMGCESCHTEPHQKKSKFPKGLSAGSPDLCFGCHDKTKFSKKSLHAPVAAGMCSSCHDPHTSDFPKLVIADNLCLTCHDKKTLTTKKVVHAPVSGGLCPSCHTPHSSDSDKLLASAQPGMCYGCHDKAKFESKFTHSPVSNGLCTSCHAAHQGDNAKLLLTQQPDLCFSCHDKADFSRKNVHTAVQMGCASCHNPHAGKQKFLFEKGINNLCLTCHAAVIKGGHVLAGHRLKGKKDYGRPDREFSCSSCHAPHSSDSIKLFRYPGKAAYDLCKYCHKY